MAEPLLFVGGLFVAGLVFSGVSISSLLVAASVVTLVVSVLRGRKAALLGPQLAGQAAPPNPSIERTRPGKPGRASHLQR